MSITRRGKFLLRVGALGAALTLVAACGDDSNGGGGSGSGSAPQPPSDAEIVKVGIYVPASDNPTGVNYGRAAEGLEAAVDAFNERGVENHPDVFYEAVTCDTREDANAVRECANEFVDEGVVATVQSFTTLWSEVGPIFEDAGVAQVTLQAIDAAQFASPVAFPVLNTLGGYAASGIELVDEGSTSVFTAITENPNAVVIPSVVDAGVEHAGGESAGSGVTNLAAGNVNWQASAQEAIGADGDAVAFGYPADAFVQFVQAAQQLGADLSYGYVSGALTEENLEQLGSDVLERVYLTGPYPPLTADDEYPGLTRFREAMEAGDAPVDEQALGAWVGLDVINQVIEAMPPDVTVDAAAVLEGVRTIQSVETNIIPPWTPGTPVILGPDGEPFAPLRAISNDSFFLTTFEGTEQVLLRDEPLSPIEEGINYVEVLTG